MEVVVKESEGILRAEFSGQFSLSELLEACARIREHRSSKKLLGYLIDFSSTYDSISILESKKFVKHLFDVCDNTKLIAILRHGGAKEGEYLCSALARTMGLVIETFDFLENALAWLKGKSVH